MKLLKEWIFAQDVRLVVVMEMMFMMSKDNERDEEAVEKGNEA